MEKQQEHWGSLPAWYLFLAAMGTSMFIIVAVTDMLGNQISAQINGWVSLVSFAMSSVGAMLLMLELTHKTKGYLIIARPFASILSFGGVIQSLYIPLVLVYASFFFNFIPWVGLVWLKMIVACLAILTGLLYVSYAGIELGEAKGRAFWNGGGLTCLFLINGAATGMAALILLMIILGYDGQAYTLAIKDLSVALLIAQAITVPGYVLGMRLSSAEEARQGADKLWRGDLSRSFWVGVITLGTVVPVIINLLFSSEYSLSLSSALILFGGIFFRVDFLRAAVRAALPGEERDEPSRKEIVELAATLESRWQEKARWLNRE
ncbi:MAG: Polysulfide reductase, NrfD [Firmicutes bacterium]|nr:Polysulfide reductase, NrfD [Bacillota bacterium]